MNLQVNLEILNEFPSEFEKKWIQGEILNEFPSEFEKKWIQGEILNGLLSEFGKKWIQQKWTNSLVNSNSLLYPPPYLFRQRWNSLIQFLSANSKTHTHMQRFTQLPLRYDLFFLARPPAHFRSGGLTGTKKKASLTAHENKEEADCRNMQQCVEYSCISNSTIWFALEAALDIEVVEEQPIFYCAACELTKTRWSAASVPPPVIGFLFDDSGGSPLPL